VATLTCTKHGDPDNPEAHAHDFVANPLAYIGHQDRLPEAKEAAAEAYALRATRETYLTAQRQLSARELHISKKKYYGLARSLSGLPSGAEGQPRALGALEPLLHQHGFEYRSRYTYTINPESGRPIARSLQQLVFWLPIQVDLAQRFITDFGCQMDATFNTNRSKLLLAIITGVTNTGSSFPAMQSFIKSESQLDWTFLLESAQQKLWKRPPKVIIADFGRGLAVALLVWQLIAVIL